MKPGLNVIRDNVPAMLAAVRTLSNERVMVGVPDVNATQGRAAGDPTNADVAFWNDQGAPEANVPARPFMAPGIKKATPEIERWLRRAGEVALSGDQAAVQRCLQAAGLVAENAIKSVITAGLAPPLAPATVEARIARRQSASWRKKRRAEVAANVAAGRPAGEGLFTPLIDTGALRASITHVIRMVK